MQGWCQQFPSHSIGDVALRRRRRALRRRGDGASFNNVDYGQYGNTYAGDQATRAATRPARRHRVDAADRRGRRAAQPGRRRTDGPGALDGTIIRVDPTTGAGAAGQPVRSAAPTPNARRILAYGLRNPFRFTFRPGTNELWIGDVGWNTWEEINRIADPTGGAADELRLALLRGQRHGSAAAATTVGNLNICEIAVQPRPGARDRAVLHLQPLRPGRARRDVPDRAARRSRGWRSTQRRLLPGELQRRRSSSPTTRRNCIWVMPAGRERPARPGRRPDVRRRRPATRSTSRSARAATSSTPTSTAAPIHRIRYTATSNQPPTAVDHAPPRRRARPR